MKYFPLTIAQCVGGICFIKQWEILPLIFRSGCSSYYAYMYIPTAGRTAAELEDWFLNTSANGYNQNFRTFYGILNHAPSFNIMQFFSTFRIFWRNFLHFRTCTVLYLVIFHFKIIFGNGYLDPRAKCIVSLNLKENLSKP